MRALAEHQPHLAVPNTPDDVTWTYARDGSLTARDGGGRWWSGCSVPAEAARAMLKSLDVRGTTACFLAPFHAAAIRVALGTLRPEQAIIAIVPDDAALAVILACDDFSGDLADQRLWFASGGQWTTQLDDLLTTHPGLPTPTQFVRLLDGIEEPAADALVSPAQQVFSDHAARRAARIARLRETSGGADREGGCVVAPSLFRLWDDAGAALARVAEELGWARFDPDVPATASPLALAERVAGAAALLTANTARADLPNVVSCDVAWITWVTNGRVPAFDAAAGPRDALLVTDPRWRDAAIGAGWPVDRVQTAAWPTEPAPAREAASGGVALIADVRPLDPPRQVVDLSSHRLLWELIRDELRADPFLATPSVTAYLDARLTRFAIAPDSLDHRLFVEALIVPAFVRGVARVLADERLRLRVYGAGWETENKLTSCWRGPIKSRAALADAVGGARALVHVWPSKFAHPIEAIDRPVLRANTGRVALLRGAQAVLCGVVPPTHCRDVPALAAQLVRELI
jgi:hypothetical protein